MSLVSLAEHDADKQIERGARGYISPFIFPQPTAAADSPDPDEAAARFFKMTPQKFRELRQWILETNKECEERLASEMVLVFRLNDQRTFMIRVGYMSKAQAVKTVRWVAAGDLLDLDNLYSGIFIRADHLFITENKIADGLRRYGSEIEPRDFINRLITERADQNRKAA